MGGCDQSDQRTGELKKNTFLHEIKARNSLKFCFSNDFN